MSIDQIVVCSVLLGAVGLFIWGRIRYDIVALLTLLAVVIAGLVPPATAFSGFGHPAVITVAAVLVISQGLRNSGIVGLLADRLEPLTDHPAVYVGALTFLCAVASAFMNNVGALAILMPVALEMSQRSGHSPAAILMPLSFGAILGGLMTMIGTPPNVIIALYRADIGMAPFDMFDFSPVGVVAAAIGVVYLVFLGRHLIPKARRAKTPPEALFQIDAYMSEARVGEDSQLVGKTLNDFAEITGDAVTVGGLIRGEERRPAPSRRTKLRADDILILHADPSELSALLKQAGLELVGDVVPEVGELRSDDVALIEAVVTHNSPAVGRSPVGIGLSWRYGLNLLAAARRSSTITARLNNMRFQPGDVLLLQGDTNTLPDTLARLQFLPLMARGLRLGQEQRILQALGIFAAALAAAAFGLLPAAVALTAASVVFVLTGLISTRELYESIDWPVIVLLGAMLPVGAALETTGTAALLAARIADTAGHMPTWFSLAIVLVVTMTLSDVMNNAATAVVMAPIAVGIADAIGASVDAFLMAVAIGASCAFLTPIGHQCNTLVLGPGGYRFGDYWRVGLPLEAIIVVIAVPMILAVWG